MSIINDALRKTQTTFEKQQKLGQPKQKNAWLQATTLIIIGGFLGCAIILTTIFISENRSAQQKQKMIQAQNPINAKQSRISTVPIPPAVKKEQPITSSSDLKLSGIMSINGEYTAIVNNKIVRVEDSIEDKKVLSISKDQVKIFDNGKVIILKIRNP